MKKAMQFFAAAVVALAVSGCHPDKVTVNLPTSEILKAISGEVGYVDTKVVFSTIDDDGKKNLGKCKAVVEKHLGENGRVTIGGDLDPDGDGSAYLTAYYKMPICQANAINTAKAAPTALVLNGSQLTYMSMPLLQRINTDLGKINGQFSAEMEGGELSLQIVGDSDKKIEVDGVAVFLDKSPKVMAHFEVAKGDTHDVLFYRSEESVWEKNVPFIIVKAQ